MAEGFRESGKVFTRISKVQQKNVFRCAKECPIRLAGRLINRWGLDTTPPSRRLSPRGRPMPNRMERFLDCEIPNPQRGGRGTMLTEPRLVLKRIARIMWNDAIHQLAPRELRKRGINYPQSVPPRSARTAETSSVAGLPRHPT